MKPFPHDATKPRDAEQGKPYVCKACVNSWVRPPKQKNILQILFIPSKKTLRGFPTQLAGILKDTIMSQSSESNTSSLRDIYLRALDVSKAVSSHSTP